MADSTFTDREFGAITVRRLRQSRSVKVRLAPNGGLVVSAPRYTPIAYVKLVIETSRTELRALAAKHIPEHSYAHGQAVGKEHSIAVVQTGTVKAPSVSLVRKHVVVKVPPNHDITAKHTQGLIRDGVARALRAEAKRILPGKLKAYASKYGFHYDRIRFSHAGSRWGSCSSTGTISLNIALMKLPDQLIDYVIVHELCHTQHMNHSGQFWNAVERIDPLFKSHRTQLKRFDTRL